ncbi:MAG: hypothetical protein ACREAC_26100, partial [Blastocatellia bacterium]
MITAISSVPAAVRTFAGMSALIEVLFPKFVVCSLPFTVIADPETNPVPVTARVNPLFPAGTCVGEIDFIEGTGLLE